MELPTYSFTENEILILKNCRDKQKNANLRVRLLAIIMIARDIGLDDIAQILGKNKNTIVNWFKIYIKKGIEALNVYNYVPKKPKLSEEQISAVINWVRENNPGTCKEAAAKIKEDYSVKYSDEGVRVLLKRHGLTFARPKTVPGNPPPEEEQKSFVEKYNDIRNNSEEGTVVLFGDGMHLVHQNIPGFCWYDPKNPMIIQTNTGRRRLNILGAYNPETGSLAHLTGEENCNAERVIEFFTLLLTVYKNSIKIILILDNASYFKAEIVREWLKDNEKLELIFLPAYSPNLNLIERLWRFVKSKIVKNAYYKKYITFRAKTFQLLNSISEYKEELKTLMVEKFEIVRYTRLMPEECGMQS